MLGQLPLQIERALPDLVALDLEHGEPAFVLAHDAVRRLGALTEPDRPGIDECRVEIHVAEETMTGELLHPRLRPLNIDVRQFLEVERRGGEQNELTHDLKELTHVN